MATITVYPDANPETSTFDGACEQRNATWSTAQTSTTSNVTDDSATTLAATQGVGVRQTGTEYRIERTFTLFDTSAIGATDTIDSATVSLYATVVVNQANTGGDTVFPTLSSPASDTAIASGDFDNCGSVASPTQGATPIDLSAITTSAYNDWSLNATGLTWIARSGESIGGGGGTAGITYLGWRMADDDTADPSYGTARNTMNASSADETGTSQDPKLVVNYTVGSTFTPRVIMY